MNTTLRYIDFFGGLHGNYLELVVNHSIDRNPYNITKNMFLTNGACHYKNTDPEYIPITKAGHWSFYNEILPKDAFVIRITIQPQDMLIGVTNSFLRAGDQQIDLSDLNVNTHTKLSRLPKATGFLDTLIQDHGIQEHYPRSALRNYFYSMFNDHENGISMYNTFLPCLNFCEFNFRNFFATDTFFQNLQTIAKFANLEFVPTTDLINLHIQFLGANQGWHSENKCNAIINAILKSDNTEIQLNIVEEAWVNYKIKQMFNLHDVPELSTDTYPKSTLQISKILFR